MKHKGARLLSYILAAAMTVTSLPFTSTAVDLEEDAPVAVTEEEDAPVAVTEEEDAPVAVTEEEDASIAVTEEEDELTDEELPPEELKDVKSGSSLRSLSLHDAGNELPSLDSYETENDIMLRIGDEYDISALSSQNVYMSTRLVERDGSINTQIYKFIDYNKSEIGIAREHIIKAITSHETDNDDEDYNIRGSYDIYLEIPGYYKKTQVAQISRDDFLIENLRLVDGNTLEWDAPPAAKWGYVSYYEIDINGNTYNHLANGGVSSVSFSSLGYYPDTDRITVTMNLYLYSARCRGPQTTEHFTTNLIRNGVIEGDILSFDAYSGADSYCIRYGDKAEFYVTDTSLDLYSALSYRVNERLCTAAIYVTPIGAHRKLCGEAYIGTYQLDRRFSNLTLQDNILSWEAYKGASAYQVYCADGEETLVKTRVTSTSYNVWEWISETLGQDVLKAMNRCRIHVVAVDSHGREISYDDSYKYYSWPRMSIGTLYGSRLSWSAFEGAQKYLVKCTDDSGETVYKSIYVTDLEIADVQQWMRDVVFEQNAYTSLYFRITPYDANGKMLAVESPRIGAYQFSYDTISGAKVEDGKVIWEAFPGAKSYIVECEKQGTVIGSNTVGKAGIDSAYQWVLKNCNPTAFAEGNDYSVTFYISALNEDGAAVSKRTRVTPAYTVPHISATLTGDSLEWNEIEDASSYRVAVKSSDQTTTYGTAWCDTNSISSVLDWMMSKEINLSQLIYETKDESVRFEITPYHQGTYGFSGVSRTYQLPSVQGITFEEDVLSWEEFAGANGYRVVFKNSKDDETVYFDCTTTQATLGDVWTFIADNEGWQALSEMGNKTNITVTALYKNRPYSLQTNALTLNYDRKKAWNTNYDEATDVLSWRAIPKAASYRIDVYNGDLDIKAPTTILAPEFKVRELLRKRRVAAGSYRFYFTAYDARGNVIVEKVLLDDEAYVYDRKIQGLMMKDGVLSWDKGLDKQFEIRIFHIGDKETQIWTNTSYVGDSLDVDKILFDRKCESGYYLIRLFAKGSGSLEESERTEYTYYFVNGVRNITFNATTGILSWESFKDADSYHVRVYSHPHEAFPWYDGEYDTDKTWLDAAMSFGPEVYERDDEEFGVAIEAFKDGVSISEEIYSEETWDEPFTMVQNPPMSLALVTDMNEKSVAWTKQPFTSGYKVELFLNDASTSISIETQESGMSLYDVFRNDSGEESVWETLPERFDCGVRVTAYTNGGRIVAQGETAPRMFAFTKEEIYEVNSISLSFEGADDEGFFVPWKGFPRVVKTRPEATGYSVREVRWLDGFGFEVSSPKANSQYSAQIYVQMTDAVTDPAALTYNLPQAINVEARQGATEKEIIIRADVAAGATTQILNANLLVGNGGAETDTVLYWDPFDGADAYEVTIWRYGDLDDILTDSDVTQSEYDVFAAMNRTPLHKAPNGWYNIQVTPLKAGKPIGDPHIAGFIFTREGYDLTELVYDSETHIVSWKDARPSEYYNITLGVARGHGISNGDLYAVDTTEMMQFKTDQMTFNLKSKLQECECYGHATIVINVQAVSESDAKYKSNVSELVLRYNDGTEREFRNVRIQGDRLSWNAIQGTDRYYIAFLDSNGNALPIGQNMAMTIEGKVVYPIVSQKETAIDVKAAIHSAMAHPNTNTTITDTYDWDTFDGKVYFRIWAFDKWRNKGRLAEYESDTLSYQFAYDNNTTIDRITLSIDGLRDGKFVIDGTLPVVNVSTGQNANSSTDKLTVERVAWNRHSQNFWRYTDDFLNLNPLPESALFDGTDELKETDMAVSSGDAVNWALAQENAEYLYAIVAIRRLGVTVTDLENPILPQGISVEGGVKNIRVLESKEDPDLFYLQIKVPVSKLRVWNVYRGDALADDATYIEANRTLVKAVGDEVELTATVGQTCDGIYWKPSTGAAFTTTSSKVLVAVPDTPVTYQAYQMHIDPATGKKVYKEASNKILLMVEEQVTAEETQIKLEVGSPFRLAATMNYTVGSNADYINGHLSGWYKVGEDGSPDQRIATSNPKKTAEGVYLDEYKTTAGAANINQLAGTYYYRRVQIVDGKNLDHRTDAITVMAHVHKWSSTWKFSNTNHWHECTEEGCEITSARYKEGFGPHEFRIEQASKAKHVKICNICNARIPADHAWDEGVVTKEPTYKAYGIKTYTCSECNETKTERIPMLVHEHKWSEAWTYQGNYHWHECEDPDCPETHNSQKAGYGRHTDIRIEQRSLVTHYKVCNDCGVKIPVNHTWDEGVITRMPSYKQTGLRTYTCTVCGQVKNETIPMLVHDHTWKEDWSSNSSYHWHDCEDADCPETHKSAKDGYAAHSFTIIQKASVEKHAVLCDVCNYRKTVYHTWDEGVILPVSGKIKYTCTICGQTRTLQLAEMPPTR